MINLGVQSPGPKPTLVEHRVWKKNNNKKQRFLSIIFVFWGGKLKILIPVSCFWNMVILEIFAPESVEPAYIRQMFFDRSLKLDGWETSFLLGPSAYFPASYVHFNWEGKSPNNKMLKHLFILKPFPKTPTLTWKTAIPFFLVSEHRSYASSKPRVASSRVESRYLLRETFEPEKFGTKSFLSGQVVEVCRAVVKGGWCDLGVALGIFCVIFFMQEIYIGDFSGWKFLPWKYTPKYNWHGA